MYLVVYEMLTKFPTHAHTVNPFRQLTIHLALIREDDLPSATWRVNGQCLLEGLLNVSSPHTLCFSV